MEMNHHIEGVEMVKAIVKKVVVIPDGAHIATIKGLEVRKTEDYGDYVDVKMKLSDVKEAEISVGYPLNVSIKSDLGKMLMATGYNITKHIDEEIDLDKILIGKVVSFVTYTEKDDNGIPTFAKVSKASIAITEKA